jgi:signal transduction histidine kinase
MDNLAGNGIRFAPRGGSVTLSATIEDNGMSVSISDNGSGFTERDLKNLFRKFYRGGVPGADTKGHSGLGLYIAKTIVEMHGGVIKAFNLAEGGACVEFDIVFL